MDFVNPSKQYKTRNHRIFSCQYHVIFCPKYRRRVLVDGVDERLKEVLMDTADMSEGRFDILEMEVMPDHVHLLIDCDPDYGIGNCIKHLKSRSAHVLLSEMPALRKKLPCLWTRSYFVSSVGAVSLDVVKQYIENQKKV